MTDQARKNRRIAKNTILLYVRMLFLMLISLYTSRVILNALGVEDYGIYNVVGGVVTMFTVISGSLSTAISRFLTFELGKGNIDKLKRIFSASITIQIGIALVIIVLAETIGLWFLNFKLVIPDERIVAANWCYQFSIITFAINLISVPYNAAIIAHERMSAFAYISILEASGKLIVAWSIEFNPIDRLIFFAAMIAVVAWTIRWVYGRYCKNHFEECTFCLIYDKALLKEMVGFAGWSFIGASSRIIRDQGGNIVLNLFFGPSVNAARGIAVKVSHTITGFVSNFMTALKPQITKSYANGDYDYMFKLVFRGSRLSFYILFLLSLPVIIDTHYLLELWLKNVPEHTVNFVRLILIDAYCECISHTLVVSMLATGNIRNYQIVVGGLQMLNLPVAYLCLCMGTSPESVIIVAIVISQCCLAARLYMLKGMINLHVRKFLKEVYLNVITVALLSSVIPLIVYNYLDESFISFIIIAFVSVISTMTVELLIGCQKEERLFAYDQVRKFLKKIK